MKTKLTLTLFTLGIAAFLGGCEETAEAPVILRPNGAALSAFTENNIEKQVQRFTLDAEDGGSIKGAQGTIIQFYGGALLTEDDQEVTGDVDIELIEIYNRSSMLLTEKPTLGENEDGDNAMLISGGEFYVNVTQNGNQLKPETGYHIIAPANKTGEVSQEMLLFTGREECNGDRCNNVWEQELDRKIEAGEFQNTGGAYAAYFAFQQKFGWTNIDRWYNDERPKTTIFIDVPEGFDNSNCAVYITYDGEPAALGRFDKYDETTGLFTEHYGLIPIGLNVHIILVSMIDDEIHYAIKSTTITSNHTEVIHDVQSITEEELVDLINTLP